LWFDSHQPLAREIAERGLELLKPGTSFSSAAFVRELLSMVQVRLSLQVPELVRVLRAAERVLRTDEVRGRTAHAAVASDELTDDRRRAERRELPHERMAARALSVAGEERGSVDDDVAGPYDRPEWVTCGGGCGRDGRREQKRQ
jgi:hypothetical protein